MQQVIYLLILLFGTASYVVGLRAILRNTYAPSVFSRVVWLVLAAISAAGVIVSQSTVASIILALVFLIGNAAICVASFFKGTRAFGKLEYACSAILLASVLAWVVFDAPLVGVGVSLLAHFVGAAPTFKRVWLKPSSESAGFWSLFFIASILSVVASWGEPLKLIIFPAYFVLFDGTMTLLSLRKK